MAHACMLVLNPIQSIVWQSDRISLVEHSSTSWACTCLSSLLCSATPSASNMICTPTTISPCEASIVTSAACQWQPELTEQPPWCPCFAALSSFCTVSCNCPSNVGLILRFYFFNYCMIYIYIFIFVFTLVNQYQIRTSAGVIFQF